MKFFTTLTLALASASLSNAISIPADVRDIEVRDSASSSFFKAPIESLNELFKRKGGGGKGGGSSSSGGSSSGGSSSSGCKSTFSSAVFVVSRAYR